jgi:hypothetical protein
VDQLPRLRHTEKTPEISGTKKIQMNQEKMYLTKHTARLFSKSHVENKKNVTKM